MDSESTGGCRRVVGASSPGILVPVRPPAWRPPACSPLSPGFRCAGSANPLEPLGGALGAVASPSYSGLWPPLEGGAWLKVMPASLSGRGLSPDPQCHLPHRLGEASWGLVLGSCLETLMNQSVNTLGFCPVWRPFRTPGPLRENVKWLQAWSRSLAELMLSGLGLSLLTSTFYSASPPIF